MFDPVVIRLTYDDAPTRYTHVMERWLADLWCEHFAAGGTWRPLEAEDDGLPVKRALIIPL